MSLSLLSLSSNVELEKVSSKADRPSFPLRSNMQMVLSQVYNASAEIAAGALYPNIRLMTVSLVSWVILLLLLRS
jgi:hypothetical protein